MLLFVRRNCYRQKPISPPRFDIFMTHVHNQNNFVPPYLLVLNKKRFRYCLWHYAFFEQWRIVFVRYSHVLKNGMNCQLEDNLN
jgi:hypothetical protein